MSSSSSSFPRSNRPQHEYDTTIATVMDNERYYYSEPSRRRQPLPRFLGPTNQEDLSYRRPLVLDPSQDQQQHSHTILSVANSEGGAISSSTFSAGNQGLVKKLLSATTRRDKNTKQPTIVQQQQEQPSYSAVTFARSAPRAGFLLKLGQNVVEFKRRFFVLEPTTHLYYFLSPNDCEPRGCIDLTSATVRDLGGLRFEIRLQDEQFVVLEARSLEVKQQWMQSLKEERIEHVKEELHKAQGCVVEQKNQVAQLEQELEQYRHVEHDRDMALEDAAAWKIQYQHLEQAVRLLTRHVRRAPSESTAETVKGNDQSARDTKEKDDCRDSQNSSNIVTAGEAGMQSIETENTSNKRLDDSKTLASKDASTDTPPPDENNNISHRETSLLDTVSHDDGSTDEQLHAAANDLDSPSFSSLLNACLQLMENMNLASVEATTAVDDLNEANNELAKLQKRMTKAERHLCKLWEENCELRTSLKSCKKEKKVLVREVKSLMAEAAEAPEQQQLAHVIDEIEEHVMTSIQLHEQLLNGGGPSVKLLTAGETGSQTTASSSANSRAMSSSTAVVPFSGPVRDQQLALRDESPEGGPSLAIDKYAVRTDGTTENGDPTRLDTANSMAGPFYPGQVISSLVDSDSDSDSDENDDLDEDSMAPSLVSLVADGQQEGGTEGNQNDHATDLAHVVHEVASETHGQGVEASVNRDGVQYPRSGIESDASSSNVSSSVMSQHRSEDDSEVAEENPLLQLNDSEDEKSSISAQPSVPQGSKPLITDNGKATSRLISPLADVAGTLEGTDGIGDDGRVYHITFYSRKIGIQFQKVPLPKTPHGLLTEAMTADYGEAVVEQQEKTASELRRIASISRQAKDEKDGQDTCPVATPVDAVLVCGLEGFNGSQTPPTMGARLVAFDGVSVERGRWTFESVREAILARARPLTLSFRNDMLTTKQRAILTKAVADVNGAAIPSARPPPAQRPSGTRGGSDTRTAIQSNDSDWRLPVDYIDKRGAQPSSNDEYDDRSVSTMASVSIASDPQSNGAPRTSPYSFSQAGSSSVVSSAFGPLMSNLMSGLSQGEKADPNSTPSYLRRDISESREGVDQHRQFRESLL